MITFDKSEAMTDAECSALVEIILAECNGVFWAYSSSSEFTIATGYEDQVLAIVIGTETHSRSSNEMNTLKELVCFMRDEFKFENHNGLTQIHSALVKHSVDAEFDRFFARQAA